MNKRVLSLIVIFFYSILSFCQSKTVENYFNDVHQAEHFIVNNNYKKALKYYQKAFKTPEISFNIDYQNALLCACKLNDKKVLKKYFTILKERAYNVDKLKKYCLKTVSQDTWNTLEKLKINPTIDTVYKNKIKEILRVDQEIRNYVGSIGGSYETHRDTIKYVDSLNLEMLKSLISIKGFPSEAKVGSHRGLIISVWHNLAWEFNILDSILNVNRKLGYFSPYEYAFLYDYWTNNFGQKRVSFRIENTHIINGTMYFDYWTKNEAQIDSLRATLFIESMEEQRYKIASNKHKEGFRFHCNYIARYNVDKEMEAKLIKTFEESRIEYENSKKNDINNKRSTRKKHRRSRRMVD